MSPLSPDLHELLFLAPEILLSVWGLVVLLADVAFLRRATGDRRRYVLGMLALVGAAGALLVALLGAVPAELNYGATTLSNPLSLREFSADLPVFFGTLSADTSTIWLNVSLAALLALTVGLSMTWNFTEHWGEYFALLFWATVGMMFLVAAEELLTLFLSLEMMTICLYLMSSLEKSRRRSAEAGLKYFVYGSVSSALFLFGLSLIYGLTHTTRLPAIRLALVSDPTWVGLQGNVAGATAVLLVLVGFGFKVAAVPFHQWAPDTYEGAPAPVSAWIASGSKIASFVALMKVLIFGLGPWATDPSRITTPGWVGLLALIAAASMTYGNFAALAQRNFKRMLAYSSVAHAGYILVGVLAVAVSRQGAGAAGGVLYYLVTYGFATVGAFAVAAWLARDLGTDEIDDLNGLGARAPGMAVCIVVLMLSLIGMPPLAGFFGKLWMFMEAMNTPETGRISLTWLVALGLFNSVVSAFYYVRVLKAMFLRPASPGRPPIRPAPSGVFWSVAVSTLVTVGFGLAPWALLDPMEDAAIPMLSANVGLGGETGESGTPEERQRKAAEYAKKVQEEGKTRLMGAGGAGGGGGGGGGRPPGGGRPNRRPPGR
jgi:NADH-quinone oxidoreductase subunit N